MNAHAVPPFDPGQQARLIKLLGLLGSDHDGEIVTAGRMAHRLVQSLGLTWADVIGGGAALKAPTRKSTKATKDWRDVCREVADDENESPWARAFCSEILTFRGVDLSRRQLARLREILEARRQRAGRAR